MYSVDCSERHFGFGQARLDALEAQIQEAQQREKGCAEQLSRAKVELAERTTAMNLVQTQLRDQECRAKAVEARLQEVETKCSTAEEIAVALRAQVRQFCSESAPCMEAYYTQKSLQVRLIT